MAINSVIQSTGVFNPPQPDTPAYQGLYAQNFNDAAQTQAFNTQWTPAVVGSSQQALDEQLFGAPASTVTQGGKTYNFGAQPGTISLLQEAQPALSALGAETATAKRGADIGDVANLGPALLAAEKADNPEASRLLDTLTSQAQQQLNTNGGLTPAQSRQYQQDFRGAEAARGLGNGSGDAAQEANYVFQNQQALRSQNEALAGSVLGANANYYGGPTAVLGLPLASDPAVNMTAPQVNLASQQQNEIDQLFGNYYGARLGQQYGAWKTQTGGQSQLASFGFGSGSNGGTTYSLGGEGLIGGIMNSGSSDGQGGSSSLGGSVGGYIASVI